MIFSFGVEKAADDKKLRTPVKERCVGRRRRCRILMNFALA